MKSRVTFLVLSHLFLISAFVAYFSIPFSRSGSMVLYNSNQEKLEVYADLVFNSDICRPTYITGSIKIGEDTYVNERFQRVASPRELLLLKMDEMGRGFIMGNLFFKEDGEWFETIYLIQVYISGRGDIQGIVLADEDSVWAAYPKE